MTHKGFDQLRRPREKANHLMQHHNILHHFFWHSIMLKNFLENYLQCIFHTTILSVSRIV